MVFCRFGCPSYQVVMYVMQHMDMGMNEQKDEDEIECLICYCDYPRDEMCSMPHCEHMLCWNCVANTAKAHIVDREVDDKFFVCPLGGKRDAGCQTSFTLTSDPMTGQQTYQPEFILKRALIVPETKKERIPGGEACWNKFERFRRRSEMNVLMCPNPKCQYNDGMPVVPEGIMWQVTCDVNAFGGCGTVFCSRGCGLDPHKGKTCAEMEKNRKLDGEQLQIRARTLAIGGRYCPKCELLCAAEDDDPDKWHCDHMTCPVQECHFEFCRHCGADRTAIEAHGNHHHLPACPLWSPLPAEEKDKPFPKWTAENYEVKVKASKTAGQRRCWGCFDLEKQGKQGDEAYCRPPLELNTIWKENDGDVGRGVVYMYPHVMACLGREVRTIAF